MSSFWHSPGKIASALAGILLVTSVCTCAFLASANRSRVVMGVSYKGIPLGGLTEQGVRDFFADVAEERLADGAVILTHGDATWRFEPEDIGLAADVDEAAATAYSIGRGGGIVANFVEQARCIMYGRSVDLTAHFVPEELDGQLMSVAQLLDQPPANAYVTMDGSGIRHVHGVTGYHLDTEIIAQDVAPALMELKTPVKREIELTEEPPTVTDADILPIDSVLAVYTTYLGSDPNRNENIRIAAGELSYELIRSGEEFSFNSAVGSRVASAGYRNANVIIEGRVEQDIGGGVCQVSSTLYNAILLAGLQPTVRTSHFFPSTYVPAGLDATVADGQIDFQFRNTLPHNVYLLADVYGNALTVYVLGTQSDLGGSTITLETATESAEPAPVVSVYRLFSRNGEVIEREYLHTDSYSPPENA